MRRRCLFGGWTGSRDGLRGGERGEGRGGESEGRAFWGGRAGSGSLADGLQGRSKRVVRPLVGSGGRAEGRRFWHVNMELRMRMLTRAPRPALSLSLSLFRQLAILSNPEPFPPPPPDSASASAATASYYHDHYHGHHSCCCCCCCSRGMRRLSAAPPFARAPSRPAQPAPIATRHSSRHTAPCASQQLPAPSIAEPRDRPAIGAARRMR